MRLSFGINAIYSMLTASSRIKNLPGRENHKITPCVQEARGTMSMRREQLLPTFSNTTRD
jgi:hypothetical protein